MKGSRLVAPLFQDFSTSIVTQSISCFLTFTLRARFDSEIDQ